MKILIPLLFVALLGCPKPGPSPVTPTASDGASSTAPTAASVCAHFSDLGCKEAESNMPGHCEEVIANIQATGVVSVNLACMQSVTSCDVIDVCNR